MRRFFNGFTLISRITLFACNTGLKQNDWHLKFIDEITFETDSLVPINPSTIALLETDSVSQLFFYNYFESKYQFHPDYDESVFRYLVVRFEKGEE
ncbi:hypothetical protein [Cyclobacterium plantarum]|uniref:hypothetical protein n=1 Tax=Cyclobacterium plantarum TaxID=2716263 RepID=UPI003F710913